MQANPQYGLSQHRRAWLTRAVMGVVLLLLSLQLLGVAYHHHDYADTTSVCATCDFDQYLPPTLPSTTVAAIPALEAISYPIATAARYISFFQPSYLIPLAQAPPQ